jgi:enoyl-CoA hydratase/carnithine racemase
MPPEQCIATWLEPRDPIWQAHPPEMTGKFMSIHVHFDIEDGVAVIRLDRPEKLNAFTPDMLEAWLAALEQCRTDPAVRVVVITGTGRAFTTGGDVDGFSASASQTAEAITAHLVNGVQRLPRKIAEIDKPVIAALNGIATGGGLDIGLACDIRYAAHSARFAETYAKLGLIPGVGGAYLLPRIIGMARALEMMWTADFVDAEEACRVGIVTKVFPDADFMDQVLAIAQRMAANSPLAVQTIKRVARLSEGEDLNTALHVVATHMPNVRMSEDHAEALSAFTEKRPPVFHGR